ncbi:MAG: hypothetical protein SFT81_05855 [Candidatus Caenarcaniphilales bacterium]|nr:hypothetical protein [Candidatus Caenarcaniphilales bacterium]
MLAQSKNFTTFFLVMLVFLTGCGIRSDQDLYQSDYGLSFKTARDFPPADQKVIDSHALDKSSKRSSWEGVWAFTVLEKDLKFYKTDSYLENKKTDRVVYTGFLLLSKSGGLAYEYLPKNKTKVIFLEFNQKDNHLAWKWKFSSQKSMTLMQTFKSTRAIYDSASDTLIGQSDMVIDFSSLIPSELPPPKLPGVSYTWQATRISEADLAKIVREQAAPTKTPETKKNKLIEV